MSTLRPTFIVAIAAVTALLAACSPPEQPMASVTAGRWDNHNVCAPVLSIPAEWHQCMDGP
jgi:hypothetical protein